MIIQMRESVVAHCVNYAEDALNREMLRIAREEASRRELRQWAHSAANRLKTPLKATSEAFHTPWTSEEASALRELKADGLSYAEIGEELGRSIESVKARWHREAKK